MTATITQPVRVEPTTSDNDDVTHVYCCDPDIAMCGADLTEHPVTDDDDDSNECRYCAYIEDENLPCPVAGCAGHQ